MDSTTDNRTLLFHPDEEGRPVLLCFHPYGHIQDIFLEGRQSFGRGTGTDSADITVSFPMISRQHGEFGVIADRVFYRDTGSSNGTWINGVLCEQMQELKDGDILSFHSRHGYVEGMEFKMVFTRLHGNGLNWKQISLTREIQEILIGRQEGSLLLEDAFVSQRHASFFLGQGGWNILDLGSTNGVYVNHQKVNGGTLLHPMDIVRIGNTWFAYYNQMLWAGQEQQQQEEVKKESLYIDIREKNVWFRFKKKTLLKDINLTVDPGDFVLILGGSGAGKTTFMNAVMGYEKAEGTVQYGELDIYEEYEKIKYEIGFVPQQDTLRLNETVYDTLYSAAQMKMPSHSSSEEYRERTQWVLSLMGLEREKETLARKLSGGQRKRLSIAVELIGNPGLFFLDEPDSGLDGIMARNLMENLKTIADLGKMVMVITHGPDRAADLFTKVLVLARSEADNSGHLVYYGGIAEALRYFHTDSLEGIVRKINRKDEGGEGMADEYIARASDR